MPMRTEVTNDMPPACLTFFVPPNDGTDETNRELISQIRKTGKFERTGTTFVTNEADDMFRRGGKFEIAAALFRYRSVANVAASNAE